MAAKKKSAKRSVNKPASNERRPQRTPAQAKKRPAKAAGSSDVVYSDVRRTMSSQLLGRLLGS